MNIVVAGDGKVGQALTRLLSDEGQEIIEKTGYVKINP